MTSPYQPDPQYQPAPYEPAQYPPAQPPITQYQAAQPPITQYQAAQPQPGQPQTLGQPQTQGQPQVGAAASRNPVVLLVTAGVVLLLVLVGATVTALYLGNVGPFKDPGLALCESIRDSQTSRNPLNISDEPDSDPSHLSEAEYKDLRSRFAASRYEDIRTAGTQFMDLAWQLNGASRGNVLGDLLLLTGPIIQAYSSLSGACANHGVTIPPGLRR